jgi:hypothetical protein
MPIFLNTWFSFQPSYFVFKHLKFITSCSLKFNDIITYALNIFLLGPLCGYFQFIPVFCRSSFLLNWPNNMFPTLQKNKNLTYSAAKLLRQKISFSAKKHMFLNMFYVQCIHILFFLIFHKIHSWEALLLHKTKHGMVVSPTYWPPLPPRNYSWYSFLLEAQSTLGP